LLEHAHGQPQQLQSRWESALTELEALRSSGGGATAG
jgi:hypothetical protein